MLQYIAPTLQFLLGVLVYDEPFTHERVIGFGIIWLALILYSAEGCSSAAPPHAARRCTALAAG